jgi:IPT/TIG domain-containing protein
MGAKDTSARAVGISLLVAVALTAIVALSPARWRDPTLAWFFDRPFDCGFLAIAVLWLIPLAITGNHPWRLIEGEDGRASTSKFQLAIWTVVAIFAYVVFTVARIKQGSFAPIYTFPPGLLLAMGFSSATAVAAKGITSNYVDSGRVAKPAATDGQSASDLVTHDSGAPDLVKVQMLTWTFVAVAVFLVSLYEHIYGPKPDLQNLPDVDEALAVLMGIGHGTYVFHKLTLSSVPVLTGLSPSTGRGVPLALKIQGNGFGPSANGSSATIDGVPVPTRSWADNEIVVNVPALNLSGPAWVGGKIIQIGVTVNGLNSNTLPFTY